MGGRLSTAVPRMIGVQQDACAKRFIVCKEARYPAVEPSDIDTNAEFEFEQLHNVCDRADTEAQALAQFHGVLLCLGTNITAQDRPLGRIVPGALYAEKIFQLDFGPCEIGEQLRGCVLSDAAAIEKLSEARREVDVHSLLAQQCVDGCAVQPDKLLQLVHPHAPLPLFDGDKSRARNLY